MRSQVVSALHVPRGLVAMVWLLSLSSAAAAQSSHPQSIYLPDPTPRPPDLQREYGDNPAERARQDQAAKLRNSMRVQQVVSATNALLALVQELKTQVDRHEMGTPMASEMVQAEQIERLAKKVKETMKSR